MGKCPFNGNACSEECALRDVRSKRCVFFTIADVLTIAADCVNEAITSSDENSPSSKLKWYRRQAEERASREEAYRIAQYEELKEASQCQR